MAGAALRYWTIVTAGLAITAAAAFAAAAEQGLPERPVVIVSPYAGGGSTDFALRSIARKVQELASLNVVIESRPGGGGTVAAQAVRSAAPDGTQLMLADVGTFASNVTVFTHLQYDPVKDFKPITTLWVIQNVLTVPADSPINSLKDLVELARKKPGGLTYASQAVGASGHLLGSMLAKMTNTNLINVPFRGALAAATEVVAGRVDFCFCAYSSIHAFVADGKLKLIALAAAKRDPILPNVPTVAEAGFPGLEMDVWFGIAAPHETPDAIIGALNKAFTAAATSPDVTAKLREESMQVMVDSPAEFASLISKEIKRYRPIVEDAGAKQD